MQTEALKSSITPLRPESSSGAIQGQSALPAPYWSSPDGQATLFHGDSLQILEDMEEESVDVVFADPPYFLSNGGSTCKSGKRASVNKGKWDQSQGPDENHAFNTRWLSACQRLLKPNGTMWVSGTSHVIYSVGFAMQQLGMKHLNEIVWEKPNPPPNLSCRYFTHSTESVIWAAKHKRSKHYFNYAEMRSRNENKQMKSVWTMTAPPKREKAHGKHPTQKPLTLLDRLLVASCPEGAHVLDPFNGSGTTGVASAKLADSLSLRYTGIDCNTEYLELTKARLFDEQPQWNGPAKKVGLRAVGD